MIRDPSDGSARLREDASPDAVREKPDLGIPRSEQFAKNANNSGLLIDTSTSGLPITKAKDLAGGIPEMAEKLRASNDQRLRDLDKPT